jgi:hypothetical protein
VGGVIGGRLHRSGRPSRRSRGAHLARIREQGLLLDTQTGNHVIAARFT